MILPIKVISTATAQLLEMASDEAPVSETDAKLHGDFLAMGEQMCYGIEMGNSRFLLKI